MEDSKYPREVLKRLLGILERRITLSNIKIEGWDDLGDEHHIEATWQKPKEGIHRYPKCGIDDPGLNLAGTPDRKLYDEPLRKPLCIELERQRHECQNCGSTNLPSHPDIYRGRKMTVRPVRYIWNSYLRGTLLSAIAEKAGPVKSTVQDVFQERAEEMDEPLTPQSATVLSIDEIHLRRHGHLAVLVDPQSREVIEVLQGMDLESTGPIPPGTP